MPSPPRNRSAARCSPSHATDIRAPCSRPATSTACERHPPVKPTPGTAVVHLVDGTYELFRHFYGLRRIPAKPGEDPDKPRDRPLGAAAGVLHTVLEMIEKGADRIGVATDHVIESFRNRL